MRVLRVVRKLTIKSLHACRTLRDIRAQHPPRCSPVKQEDNVQHDELSGALRRVLRKHGPHCTSAGASIPQSADEADRNRTIQRGIWRVCGKAGYMQRGEKLTPVPSMDGPVLAHCLHSNPCKGVSSRTLWALKVPVGGEPLKAYRAMPARLALTGLF